MFAPKNVCHLFSRAILIPFFSESNSKFFSFTFQNCLHFSTTCIIISLLLLLFTLVFYVLTSVSALLFSLSLHSSLFDIHVVFSLTISITLSHLLPNLFPSKFIHMNSSCKMDHWIGWLADNGRERVLPHLSLFVYWKDGVCVWGAVVKAKA